ncbi:tRNA (guanine37-N1)-methyltransferase [Agromyces hippuratus]|uniref:tRNA (Guanine37-N1)-methyltransferase n=1 Tax=Agromyces hippuratus TaxID=286438 RepID=A0A852WXA4_9MICO|nr:GNAT family N-acetyltransferase [Agromyces hippuratus]NYG22267.1 tRNA (guanine37-N1)-methyltransferase [Agromyces hippuratus]
MTQTTASAVRIRPAAMTDAAALAALAAATFPLACPPHTTPEAVADFIARNFGVEHFEGYLADSERILLVAEGPVDPAEASGHSRLLGYTMLIGGEPGDADAASAVTARPAIELSKVYVLAESHGTGAGAALMRASLDAARATGAATTWLGVNEENARAIAFYERHGFAKVGHKHFVVGGRVEDDWVMEHPLVAP